ncbi:integrator complex subunit 9 homolog [Phalaenopsis equestris]|uniref:integrator complex subunit 9 homolog n=1 Tax=Phalaenopsis equestris TaxID=78828 RepID=UPI0009E26C1F|nr:integrator complex subunit 9 homolog [Phalaenopsis equestris]
MKLTCLSKGSGLHYPPCHMLEFCGLRLLLECPIDLSALNIFSPISASHELDLSGFISAEPWYKTAKNLHLWDVSLIDVVLISSPAGMLGMPFLTRNPRFSAKIYATEATMKIGRFMMDDLISMHSEYVMFYGHDEKTSFPDWMGWEELGRLSLKAKEVVMGEDGEELGCWLPLYSAADVDICMEKIQPLKYAEEACYNSILVLKAFSSGLDIGSCNWRINSPRRNFVYLSTSIFESPIAIDFDYRSLEGADILLFSDMSAINDIEEECNLIGGSQSDLNKDDKDLHVGNASIPRACLAEDELSEFLADNCEILEENDKMSFITSYIVDSVREGGSVLIPIGQLGTVLQLLEQISDLLKSLSLEVPIFIVSTTAEQTLAFTNAIPEWLCKKRQQKLFCGQPLFGHAELITEKKLHVFPLLYSSDLLLAWQEPCIVFAPHWSLRLGPAIHLLSRWHADSRCLLILQQGIDAEVALLPFKTVLMRVLECSFISGIQKHKIFPLLSFLHPKLVLFPEDLRPLCTSQPNISFSLLFYSVNSTLRVPSLQNNFEGRLATDLVFQLQPRRLYSKEMAIARLIGKLVLSRGKYLLVSPKKPIYLPSLRILLWGSVDAASLLVALKEKGIDCSIENEVAGSYDHTQSVRIRVSEKAVIETNETKTVICTENEVTAGLIHEALGSICDGI